MLSIFGIIKGIGILSKIKSFFGNKDNQKDILFFCLIMVFVIVIIIMSIRLMSRRRQVEKLEIKIEALEVSNEVLIAEQLTLSNKLFIQASFSNTTTKIIMITNDFYLEEEDIILRENFKYDFYKE